MTTLDPNIVHYLCDTGDKLVLATDLEEDFVSFGSLYIYGTLPEYQFRAVHKGKTTWCTLQVQGDTAVAKTPFGEVFFELQPHLGARMLMEAGSEIEEIFEKHGYLLLGGSGEIA